MRGNNLRKLFVVLIIVAFASTDCKKQPKCGCGKDILRTLKTESVYVFFNEDKTIITFQILMDQFSTYTLCNPSEMAPNLKDAKSGDILKVSGEVYWDCNYVMQASNSSYSSMYKAYQVQASDLTLDQYGSVPQNKPL